MSFIISMSEKLSVWNTTRLQTPAQNFQFSNSSFKRFGISFFAMQQLKSFYLTHTFLFCVWGGYVLGHSFLCFGWWLVFIVNDMSSGFYFHWQVGMLKLVLPSGWRLFFTFSFWSPVACFFSLLRFVVEEDSRLAAFSAPGRHYIGWTKI